MLKQDSDQPAAYGLLKNINKVKLIGTVNILKWILPVLANLSKSFQKGAFNYVSIKPSIDYSKDKLNYVKITEARLCLLGISMGSNAENALSTGRGDLNLFSMFLTRALRYFWRKYLLIFGFTSVHTV